MERKRASLNRIVLRARQLSNVKIGRCVASGVIPERDEPIAVPDHGIQLKVGPDRRLKLPLQRLGGRGQGSCHRS